MTAVHMAPIAGASDRFACGTLTAHVTCKPNLHCRVQAAPCPAQSVPTRDLALQGAISVSSVPLARAQEAPAHRMCTNGHTRRRDLLLARWRRRWGRSQVARCPVCVLTLLLRLHTSHLLDITLSYTPLSTKHVANLTLASHEQLPTTILSSALALLKATFEGPRRRWLVVPLLSRCSSFVEHWPGNDIGRNSTNGETCKRNRHMWFEHCSQEG
jgi:hypothetical protein